MLGTFPSNQGTGRDHVDSSLVRVAATTVSSGPNGGTLYQALVATPVEASAPGTGVSVVAFGDQI